MNGGGAPRSAVVMVLNRKERKLLRLRQDTKKMLGCRVHVHVHVQIMSASDCLSRVARVRFSDVCGGCSDSVSVLGGVSFALPHVNSATGKHAPLRLED